MSISQIQTPSNLCLHKWMILPMKMMTMMIPLKNNSQVPTSINDIIHESKPLNGEFNECICKILPLFHLYGC